MNAKICRKLDMFERVRVCVLRYALRSAGPVAVAALQQLEVSIERLSAAAAGQIASREASAGGVSWREACWRELRGKLVDINRTGRVLGDVSVRPKFCLPRSRSYPKLIASAKVIIATARSMEGLFLGAGMQADFLEEIEQLLAAFESATDQKISGKLAQVEATTELALQARLGLAAATTLDACARNYFRGNAEALGAWVVARHIERSPVRRKERPATPEAQPLGPVEQPLGPVENSTVMIAATGDPVIASVGLRK